MIIDLDSWKKNHEDTLGTGEFFAKESSNNGGSFGSLLVRVQVQEREMGGGGGMRLSHTSTNAYVDGRKRDGAEGVRCQMPF